MMEVSSHALSQSRVEEIFFDVAAITNLSQDHLDYHGDMDKYLRSKLVLFQNHIKKSGVAVLPLAGHDKGKEWLGIIEKSCCEDEIKIVSWGSEKNADFRLLDHSITLAETTMQLETPAGKCTII